MKHLIPLLWIVACLFVPRLSAAAELDARTATEYERHLAIVTQAFEKQIGDEPFLAAQTIDALTRMRGGEIVLAPGTGDGITDVPKGLFHHWRAAAFIPNITLERLLPIVQDYSTYADVYDWLIASQLVSREGDRYRSYFRVKQSAGVVTGVIDVWMISTLMLARENSNAVYAATGVRDGFHNAATAICATRRTHPCPTCCWRCCTRWARG